MVGWPVGLAGSGVADQRGAPQSNGWAPASRGLRTGTPASSYDIIGNIFLNPASYKWMLTMSSKVMLFAHPSLPWSIG